MKKFLLVFLCCLGGEIVSGDLDWCALDCEGEKNTMCQYKPQTNSGECTNIQTATTPTMRKDILHKHNEYRNKMANGEIVENGVTWPKASNMREMSWDTNLEELALRWVQQCFKSPPHDTCRRTPEFNYNGQNKGWAGSTDSFPSPYGSFDGWVSEITLTSPGIVDQLVNAGGALHFTQVIWAESYKLGCAAIHADQNGFKTTTIACNYGPGGNILTQRIYVRGDPCGACPSGTFCSSDSTYPQLCALPTDPKKPEDIPDGSPTGSGSSKLPTDPSTPGSGPSKLPADPSTPGTGPSKLPTDPKKPGDVPKPSPTGSGSSKPKLYGMQPENSIILVPSLSFIITSLTIKITY